MIYNRVDGAFLRDSIIEICANHGFSFNEIALTKFNDDAEATIKGALTDAKSDNAIVLTDRLRALEIEIANCDKSDYEWYSLNASANHESILLVINFNG